MEGWYLDSDLSRVPFADYPSEAVLKYRVKYHIPYAGIASEIAVTPNLAAYAKVIFSPLVSVEDFDDHLLRFKTMNGSTTGGIFGFEGSSFYTLKAFGKINFRFSLGCEYTTISTTGDETQNWYGDDPASYDDDTGQEISGLDHTVKSSQKAIKAGLILEF